jgi:hypothetical protein
MLKGRFLLNTFGVFPYYESFGKEILSLSIIQRLYPTIRKIIGALEGKASQESWMEYKNVLSLFTSITIKAEMQNNELLGISVESVVDEK